MLPRHELNRLLLSESRRPQLILDASCRLSGTDLKILAGRWKQEVRSLRSSQRIDEIFAAAIEASRRIHSLVHYPVQVLGGLQLLRNRIVEMETGEGKTLTAILPIAVRAITGKGCHVLTSNDYLAKRDAEFALPILEQLGLTVGYIQTAMEDAERAEAYRCDMTYGTDTEMGFDFLRDRLRSGPREAAVDQLFRRSHAVGSVQRGHHFALVDEADTCSSMTP